MNTTYTISVVAISTCVTVDTFDTTDGPEWFRGSSGIEGAWVGDQAIVDEIKKKFERKHGVAPDPGDLVCIWGE